MKKAIVVSIVLVLFAASCSKSDPNQDASNIVAGLAGNTGSSLAKNSLTAPPEGAPPDQVGAVINEKVEGVLWLLRFVDFSSNTADLTLPSGAGQICAGSTIGDCTTSCNGADTIYTASCTLPSSATETCDGTQYTFSSASFSVAADFSQVTGTYGGGDAGGTLGLSITIQGDVSGGSLNGGQLKCTLDFSVNITALRAGTVQNFTPSCDTNYSCSYGGNAISCSDIQSKIANSKISCS